MLAPVLRDILDPPPFFTNLTTSIAAMFAGGRQLGWYDPSDMATLFQDTLGTVPVTASGQPVGLMMDKSGRGNHVGQLVLASRPLFIQDANGKRSLEFDGLDDFLSVSMVNMTAYSRVGVAAGVFRATGSGTSAIAELSASSSTNNGSFGLLGTASLASFRSKGTAAVVIANSMQTVAPSANVFTGYASILDDITQITNNGWGLTQSLVDQGLGPYGLYSFFVGRRNGSTLPLSGKLYGLIVLADPAPEELVTMTSYLNSKTGAY